MRKLAFALTATILLAACGGSGGARPAASAAPLEKTTIKMAVGGQGQFIYLPLTLADRLGYFKAEGITVEISDLKGGSQAAEALAGGSVDVTTGFYEHTIRLQVQGKKLVLFALFDLYPGLVLLVGKKHINDVHSIKDLVGHPVGVTSPGSSTDEMVKYLAKTAGLDPKAIPVAAIGSGSTAIAAINNDQVWAGVTVDPTASVLEKAGNKVIYDTRTQLGTKDVFGGSWPAGGFYTTADFVKQNPNTTEALARAAVKTLRYVHTHSADDIASHMPQAFYEGDKSLYVSALKANLPMFSPDGVMPADGPPDVLKTLSLVDPKITPDKVDLRATYDNSWVQKVH